MNNDAVMGAEEAFLNMRLAEVLYFHTAFYIFIFGGFQQGTRARERAGWWVGGLVSATRVFAWAFQ